ncbi:hemerythrin domain-containing protein [Streptomyces sp. NPDC048392]|uniref:hemerythrin domain-containing protein n=1 Tax=Streptomyces sp. NPDC048392 TaxID=3365543 RepID=UPI0037158493
MTRESLADGTPGEAATRELLLYCHGFCAALDGHHRGEDRTLFPAVEAEHRELRAVLRQQDHSVIVHLIGGLRAAVDRTAPPEELDRHIEGIAAIMENHFRYEERQRHYQHTRTAADRAGHRSRRSGLRGRYSPPRPGRDRPQGLGRRRQPQGCRQHSPQGVPLRRRRPSHPSPAFPRGAGRSPSVAVDVWEA